MPRIPMGNFGNAIASAPPRVNIPAGAFDSGGRGLQQLGEAITQGADKAMQEEERKALEQKKQDEALARAKAGNAVLDREITIDAINKDIEQQVATGAIHYTEAPTIYKKRVSEIEAPNMAGLNPVDVENFSKGLKRVDYKGEAVIGGVVEKAKLVDMRTQADGLLDKLGKMSGLPGADMAKIEAQANALDEIGLQAYGASWGKRKQDWIDNNWDAQLNQQAMMVRDDMKGITALQQRISSGDLAERLDPNRRNSLVAKLDGYKTSLIQRQEAAASRAERAQERALKVAEAEFNTFQGMADKGTIMAPEYVDRAIQLTKGTPYQAGVVALAKQAQEVGGLASQPVRNQQELLDQIDRTIATTGRTPELDKRREQIKKVIDGTQADIKQDGLRAGLERGVITELAPIDVSSPQGFASSVAKRLEQAQTVGLWAGKSVSPLDEREADQVRQMIDALPPKQKSQAVATLAESVGPRAAAAIADQLDNKDKALSLAFATAGGKVPSTTSGFFTKTTTEERYTSELILKGSGAIKDGTVMKDDKRVTGWKALIAKEVDGAFSDEKTAAKVKESAYFIAAGLASEQGGMLNSADLKRSVGLAVGGQIIERNGKKLPIPAGVDENALDKRLKSVTADEITRQAPGGKVRVGGIDMSAEDFARSIPGQELLYAGPGRYAVVVRGRPVVNAAGRPIIIGVK